MPLAGIETLATAGRCLAGALPLAGIGAHALALVTTGMQGHWRAGKQRGGGHRNRGAGGFLDAIHICALFKSVAAATRNMIINRK